MVYHIVNEKPEDLLWVSLSCGGATSGAVLSQNCGSLELTVYIVKLIHL